MKPAIPALVDQLADIHTQTGEMMVELSATAAAVAQLAPLRSHGCDFSLDLWGFTRLVSHLPMSYLSRFDILLK